MIKLKDIILEIFDSPFVYKQEKSNINGKIFSFKTENQENYIVSIIDGSLNKTINLFKDSDEQGNNILYSITKNKYFTFHSFVYIIEFYKFPTKLNKIVGLLFPKKKFNIQKTKNFIKVFSTIQQIIVDNVPLNQIIFFAAKEKSRVKLYEKMIEKYKEKYNLITFFSKKTNHQCFFLIPKI